MALKLRNLDSVTRDFMVKEIQADSATGSVYLSRFLTEKGREQWSQLLLEAAQKHDSTWLAEKLVAEDLAVEQYRMTDKNGRERTVKLQPTSLADSEFNRYYIRGLCQRAIQEGAPAVVSYRAKRVRNAVSPVGQLINPKKLLLDLRSNKGETVLDVPSNPNSGISVMLPRQTDTKPAKKTSRKSGTKAGTKASDKK